jgi:hypothetical protein
MGVPCKCGHAGARIAATVLWECIHQCGAPCSMMTPGWIVELKK